MIQDLLVFSRVGNKEKAHRTIAAESALQEALVNLKASIEENGAIVTHDPLPILLMNEMELVQLFQNLVGNAIKYRSASVPEVHISVANRAGKEWVFSVHDNGLGIEPQYLEKIFILFQRLHGRQQFSGTGIGLALCRKIVEKSGGSIWAESQPGNGSTFYFSLPSVLAPGPKQSKDEIE